MPLSTNIPFDMIIQKNKVPPVKIEDEIDEANNSSFDIQLDELLEIIENDLNEMHRAQFTIKPDKTEFLLDGAKSDVNVIQNSIKIVNENKCAHIENIVNDLIESIAVVEAEN